MAGEGCVRNGQRDDRQLQPVDVFAGHGHAAQFIHGAARQVVRGQHFEGKDHAREAHGTAGQHVVVLEEERGGVFDQNVGEAARDREHGEQAREMGRAEASLQRPTLHAERGHVVVQVPVVGVKESAEDEPRPLLLPEDVASGQANALDGQIERLVQLEVDDHMQSYARQSDRW